MTPMLETRGLVFQNKIRYPDLTLQEGRVTFLSGPSGVGKSTLLHLFNGTLSPTAGQVRYHGGDIAHMDTLALRRELLLVRQSAFLFDRTVRENFAEYHSYRQEPDPPTEDVKMWLAVCMADFPLEQSCATLSGGERQRVCLAVGLSFRPKVLLLDEPTSALDTAMGQRLMAQLLAYCRENGITPVVVSHDQGLTETFAEERLTLNGEG